MFSMDEIVEYNSSNTVREALTLNTFASGLHDMERCTLNDASLNQTRSEPLENYF